MFEISGKVVFITGALGGIGRAYVKELLKHQAKAVVLTDIDDTLADSFQEEIANEFGPNKTLFIKVDVTVPKQIEIALERTVQLYKHLDIVIGNHGILDEIDYKATIDVNLIGTFHLLYLVVEKYLPKYKSGDEAIFFNTASVSGITPVSVLPAYTATKHAMVGFTRSLGKPEHYARHKVKFITVCGTATDTPMTHEFLAPEPYMSLYTPYIGLVLESMQSCQSAANAMIKSITEGENGSVWFCEKDKPATVVNFPNLADLL